MVSHLVSVCEEIPADSLARILAVAQSPTAQANAAAAPPLTRQQLDTVRAAFRSATPAPLSDAA